MLQIPEHTWGVDIKTGLGDYKNWSNANFHGELARNAPNYNVTVHSWQRQRRYLSWAVEELGETFPASSHRHPPQATPILALPSVYLPQIAHPS